MVERAGRFVEEPDRSRRRDQTGERDPPTLARGKPTAWPVGNPVEGECGKRCVEKARHSARLRTPERCPERQGFARRKAGFYAILMADKVQLRAIGGALGLDWRSAPEKTAAGRRDQCGEDTQQAGLAAAVGSGEQQSASCRQAKRQPGKDQALAAPASESPRRPDRVRSTALGGQKSGSGGGKPEPRGHGRIARPSTRFGGQTCKDQPYAYHMGSRLGRRFEKIVTFR